MLDITLETDLFKKDARKAHLTHEKALPEATRYTLNELAFQTMKRSKKDLKKHFTLRNAWTKKSIGANKVGSTTDIARMQSEAGSTLGYMKEQQEGVNETATGKHGVPIPTNVASGEGGTGKRRKKVLRRFYLNRLKVAQGVYLEAKKASKSHKQHYAIALDITRRRKKMFLFWKSKRSNRKGLYMLDKGNPWAINMVYDLTQQRIKSDPRHWLTESRDESMKLLRKIYGRALSFNIRKYS